MGVMVVFSLRLSALLVNILLYFIIIIIIIMLCLLVQIREWSPTVLDL